MFRKLRILILLIIFTTVALNTWRDQHRLQEWQNTTHVVVYPIAGDDSPTTARYLSQLTPETFAEIGEWMQEETRRYGKTLLQPLSMDLAPLASAQPPLPPQRGSALDAMQWSLKFRWWAWRHGDVGGREPDIRLFVLFHDPDLLPALPHSIALSKGQLGLVHAFASRNQRRQNNVVIAHELLHVFGATDKYDPASSLPTWPDGYAEPEKQPRFPQNFAEIMGGRTPVDDRHANMPGGLSETLIGAKTAAEIKLLR